MKIVKVIVNFTTLSLFLILHSDVLMQIKYVHFYFQPAQSTSVHSPCYRQKSDYVPMELLPLLCLVSSAVIWGVTDALMKQTAPPSSSSSSVTSTLLSLISSPAYLSLLLVNQLGSLLYYFSLSLARLSIISPVVNTGKFIVTATTGRFLGEPNPSQRKAAGLLLLLLGVILQLTA